MMNGQDFLRNAWRASCGLQDEEPMAVPSLDALKQSEWSPRFERLMRNRLIMGAFRYGLLNAKANRQYDRVASIIKRLNKYTADGNTEHLVDAANLCLMEFEEGKHPNKHFRSIDDGEHTSKKSDLAQVDAN
jgi:hypothetical protein